MDGKIFAHIGLLVGMIAFAPQGLANRDCSRHLSAEETISRNAAILSSIGLSTPVRIVLGSPPRPVQGYVRQVGPRNVTLLLPNGTGHWRSESYDMLFVREVEVLSQDLENGHFRQGMAEPEREDGGFVSVRMSPPSDIQDSGGGRFYSPSYRPRNPRD